MGLGRYLMTRLVKWAKGKKLHRLYGDVLEANGPMLSLAESLGFQREFRAESSGLVRVFSSSVTRTHGRTLSDPQRTSVQHQHDR